MDPSNYRDHITEQLDDFAKQMSDLVHRKFPKVDHEKIYTEFVERKSTQWRAFHKDLPAVIAAFRDAPLEYMNVNMAERYENSARFADSIKTMYQNVITNMHAENATLKQQILELKANTFDQIQGSIDKLIKKKRKRGDDDAPSHFSTPSTPFLLAVTPKHIRSINFKDDVDPPAPIPRSKKARTKDDSPSFNKARRNSNPEEVPLPESPIEEQSRADTPKIVSDDEDNAMYGYDD
ncbi:hypothetical protein H9P43_009121 [Blastocladiella emersonii ATCC 22665]|nr:hypothetical protein H9P43_009121 [Blastocladiella emersonii ATCC 22665]